VGAIVVLGAAGSSFAQQPPPSTPVQPAAGPLEPPKFQPAPIPEAVADSVKKSVKEVDPFDTETSLGASGPAKPVAQTAAPAAAPTTTPTTAPTPTPTTALPSLATPAPAPRTSTTPAPRPAPTPAAPIPPTTVPDASPGLTPSTPVPVPPTSPRTAPPVRSDAATSAVPPPPSPSQYEDLGPSPEPTVARRAPEPRSHYAGPDMGLQAGGGLMQFGSTQMQEMTGSGGYWDARLVLAMRKVFSFELAYVGSTTALSAPGVAQGSSLVGHGGEGNLRLNIPFLGRDGAYVLPYGLAGMGWQHYRVSNGDTSGVALAASDDVVTIPIGAGVTIGYRHLYLDARVIYRFSQYEDMLTAGGSNQLQQWTFGGNVGYVF